jgi:hypothetical protein
MRRAMRIGRAIGGYTLGSLASLVDASGEIYLVDIGNGGIFRLRGALVSLLQSLQSLSSLSESRWRRLRQGGVIH